MAESALTGERPGAGGYRHACAQHTQPLVCDDGGERSAVGAQRSRSAPLPRPPRTRGCNTRSSPSRSAILQPLQFLASALKSEPMSLDPRLLGDATTLLPFSHHSRGRGWQLLTHTFSSASAVNDMWVSYSDASPSAARRAQLLEGPHCSKASEVPPPCSTASTSPVRAGRKGRRPRTTPSPKLLQRDMLLAAPLLSDAVSSVAPLLEQAWEATALSLSPESVRTMARLVVAPDVAGFTRAAAAAVLRRAALDPQGGRLLAEEGALSALCAVVTSNEPLEAAGLKPLVEQAMLALGQLAERESACSLIQQHRTVRAIIQRVGSPHASLAESALKLLSALAELSAAREEARCIFAITY